MTFTPTSEQLTIVEAATQTRDNLLLSALAGAAKTSTLELICKALPGIPTLFLAFNKRISDEGRSRLPSHVVCKTINAIGHSVWGQALGKKRLILNTKKTFDLLKIVLDDLPRADRGDVEMGEVIRAVSSAKLQGHIPEDKFLDTPRLIDPETFWSSFDEEPSWLMKHLVNETLERSIKLAYEGTIDFDDQVFMSTLFNGTFPRFPLVMVDEAQDLSPLNHAFLAKLVTGRIIAVGDRLQSIYAFRGAATNSMSKLQSAFSMKELPLSISFRCPREVIRAARFRAPNMQWPDWAIEGEVRDLETWNAKDIPDDSAIICRNNAPLFKCALNLIRLGRGVRLVGSDLGPQLIKVLKKLGPESLDQAETLKAIDAWERDRLRKSRAKASIADKAECLRVFAAFGPTLGAAIAYAEHLFTASGPIQLMSGHKAKGLEFDTVYFLDPDLIPSKWSVTDEDFDQESNLKYVVITRAKRALYYVELETLS